MVVKVLPNDGKTAAMARGHWLDPLARKILQAMGDLPADASASSPPDTAREPDWFLDVNRATARQWKQLPGCNDAMVDLLIRLQQGGVQFSQADDLFQLLDLSPTLAERWRPHLIFHWYGDSPPLIRPRPIDLNVDAASSLEAALHWPPQRLERLIQERRRRPFDHLADLQERLCLPPQTVEALIGRVRFGASRPGPSLPPGC